MPTQITRRSVLHRSMAAKLLSAVPGRPIPQKTGWDESSTAEMVTEGIDLSGQTALVTGCNSGLGYETMRVTADYLA